MQLKTHPATWWFLAICLVVAATIRYEFSAFIAIIAASLGLMAASRKKAIRFYLGLGLFVVLVRIVFRVVFASGSTGGEVLLNLPTLQLGGIALLGPLSVRTFESALTDGLRLAAIVLAIGMANTLANPKRLLKSMPGALYEVATAMTVAINLAPQLIESLQRVRKARRLRGRSKGIRALPSIVIPALEDTIEQSLALAASMDARGFGRRGDLTYREVLAIRTLSLGGILLISISVYLFLATQLQQLGFGLLLAGLVALAATIRLTSRRMLRTKYNRQSLLLADYLISALAIGLAVSAVVL